MWTRAQLIAAYPALTKLPASLGLQKWHIAEEDVPEEFRPFVHYAELWGIGDDETRENLVDGAPSSLVANLIDTIYLPVGRPLGPVARRSGSRWTVV